MLPKPSPLAGPNPAFFATLYDERTRSGEVRMHPWQIETAIRYAGLDRDLDAVVNRICLVANNGSGKSAKVVAPAAAWTAMAYEESRTVVTSASGKQLDLQTGRAIRAMCETVNATLRQEVWQIKYRDYTYTHPSGKRSTIEMFATDEPGKAEGWHPHVPGGVFSVITDEAKTIADEMFQPLERCNGKTHWLNVSSPGAPVGYFYNACTNGRWWTKKVTAYDCPHIKQDEIDAAREAYGEHSAFFRSAYLAEFTSVNENIVIPYDRITRHFRALPSHMDDGRRRCGVDLAAGGDENCISIWQGNKQIEQISMRIEDTRVTMQLLIDTFKRFSLKGSDIFIDDGYIGRAISHGLRDHGYECRIVNFGSRAYNNVAYGNRGTELWMTFERLFDDLIPMDDGLLKKQLASRYYKRSDKTGNIVLESKREAKAAGHSSPDRADAAVLAWADTPAGYFANGRVKRVDGALDEAEHPVAALIQRLHKAKGEVDLTADQVLAIEDLYRSVRAERRNRGDAAEVSNSDGGLRGIVSRYSGSRAYGSLQEILNIQRQGN